jgi:hypothetical protein
VVCGVVREWLGRVWFHLSHLEGNDPLVIGAD